jgi:hypothetical protein
MRVTFPADGTEVLHRKHEIKTLPRIEVNVWPNTYALAVTAKTRRVKKGEHLAPFESLLVSVP